MYKVAAALVLLTVCGIPSMVIAEDGYEMWLRYQPLAKQEKRQAQRQINRLIIEGDSPTLTAARKELQIGLGSMLGTDIELSERVGNGALILGTPANSPLIEGLNLGQRLEVLGSEGFIIERARIRRRQVTVIAANSDIGVLYGAFHLLRELQTQQDISAIQVASSPRLQHRVVNHWDDLNRVVERGYGGLSLWEWGNLPHQRSPRYTDYARLNASLGINGAAINNVNADPRILSDQFLEKVAALADTFRPYGIKMFLSVNYASPQAFGDLDTSDPLDPKVQTWWKNRVEKVYSYIPDFGGFLVKANSEGQPGPHDYGRNHADGANTLAQALKPHGGIVIWRAFVYNPAQKDRFREAYDEFLPLDGKFMDNVIVQVKNGPIDFQPREPFSPLFGAMKNTPVMLEVQVTQEYFGFSQHLAYQGPLFTEVLNTDTHAKGEGSTVGRVLEGDVFDYPLTGMAGVINPGTDRNWTGHPFVQSSWYAFGRLAWDWTLSAEEIADEWLRMTFSNNVKFVDPVKEIMMESREAGVNYRMPLGLTHLYAQGHHYGPAPWTDNLPRADWTAVYYHQASPEAIGFDRTAAGSNAVAQYHPPVAQLFADIDRVPDDFLLWFHRVGWDHEMQSGRTLWNELAHKYYEGVEQVRDMRAQWQKMKGLIDPQRFSQVAALLAIQERDAIRWRDSCVLYFQTFSGKPIPEGFEKPEHDLEHYKKLERTFYVPEPWHPASSSRVLQ